jgi:ATP-dependent Clp protease ATP-binding subunit ClpB
MTNLIEYTPELKRAVSIAQSFAKEFQHAHFSSAHLLKALMHYEIGLMDLMIQMGQDINYIEEWADTRISQCAKSPRPVPNMTGDESIYRVMEEAELVKLKLVKEVLDPQCVLVALTMPGIGFTFDQLKTLPLRSQDLLDNMGGNVPTPASGSNGISTGNKAANALASGGGQQGALLTYTRDKTALAMEQKLDPIIGRDKEVRLVAEILGRRSKPNVIIIGEPGVGKTALVDGFALLIADGKVNENLKNARIFELDFGSLVAGASYKGEIEDRLKSIISELKQYEKAILFIDEIHTLLDKNSGASNAAQLLKPELARGEITLIGATTLEEYRKHVEKDEAFNRRFELVKVEEPDLITATKMVERIVPLYENHHNMKFAPDAAGESVKLAKRYIKDRRLPDAAIDLIDRTMAAVKLMTDTSQKEVDSLTEDFNKLKESVSENMLADSKWMYRELKNKISPILFGFVEEVSDVEKSDSVDEIHDTIEKVLAQLNAHLQIEKLRVESSDIAAVVASKTGIPIGKIQKSESEKILAMESILSKRVIGQDHAIKVIADSIIQSRAGLNKPGQPIGSFFFLGPTGTGKTELAKSLAEFLFNDENAMIRFDMAEFKEEHSAALLNGAPPGYVGYEEGGVLVNKIREQPYAVVLFDEIEKAHNSVWDLFLGILDEGKLDDRLGKRGDFSNAVILFTSNVGSDYVVDRFAKNEIPSAQDMMGVMQNQMKDGKPVFRPEFLARITEIIPFAPIHTDNVVKIFDIHLSKLLKPLAAQGITLEIEPETKKKIALEGFDPKYGARPLAGIIRNKLAKPLAHKIMNKEIGKGSKVVLEMNADGELIFKI